MGEINTRMMDDLYTFDVYKVYLVDDETGLELYSSSLTDTSLQFSEDIKEIRAGVGNKLLTDIPNNKDIKIELTDVKTRLDWIAAKQGTELVTGKQIAWSLPKTYTVTEVGKLTLSIAPKDVSKVKFMKKGASGYASITGTVTGTTATITGAVVGDEIFVNGYQYETSVDAIAIDFDTEKFAKSFKTILEGIVFDGNRKPRFKKQYYFPKGTLDGNMDDSTKSERDASQTKTTIKIGTVGDSTSLGKLMFIPIA